MRITHPIDGTFSTYTRGEIHPATEDERRELETAGVWDETHLVDRLSQRDEAEVRECRGMKRLSSASDEAGWSRKPDATHSGNPEGATLRLSELG
jgi:hypothetical protein